MKRLSLQRNRKTQEFLLQYLYSYPNILLCHETTMREILAGPVPRLRYLPYRVSDLLFQDKTSKKIYIY